MRHLPLSPHRSSAPGAPPPPSGPLEPLASTVRSEAGSVSGKDGSRAAEAGALRHDPHVGGAIPPGLGLGIQIGVAEEISSVEEVSAEVANRALDLALGFRPIGAARPDPEAPVGTEAEE